MNSAQCAQVSGFNAAAFRIAPLDNEPGEGCVGDGSLLMCARSINKSIVNYHWCAGLPRAIRCDIHYCEYDSCFDTSCNITDAYCCAKEENQESPDWDIAEANACEF